MERVRDLRLFGEDLENRIIGSSTECPTPGEPGRIEMEAGLSEGYTNREPPRAMRPQSPPFTAGLGGKVIITGAGGAITTFSPPF